MSDGGLITCLLEMAFGGISGITVDLSSVPQLKHSGQNVSPLDFLFAEELGIVIEIHPNNLDHVLSQFDDNGIPRYVIGHSSGFGVDSKVCKLFLLMFVLMIHIFEMYYFLLFMSLVDFMLSVSSLL